jgi:hypothetical protein
VLFSVQKDGAGLPRTKGGMDHRYFYGRWDGKEWKAHEIAYAGTRLYSSEDDYTALATFDSKDLNIVYIATDAYPTSGEALVSRTDGKRHREIFRGIADADRVTWKWTPITAHSNTDNLRPIIPKWDNDKTALVWMRGGYIQNHGEWTTRVVAAIFS